MLTYKQYITELFDSHFEYKKVGVTKGDDEVVGDTHHYEFNDHKGKPVSVRVVHWPNNKSAEVWFSRHSTTAQTRDAPKHAHKILGTVLKGIAMDHAREHPSLKSIYFTSSKIGSDRSGSRASLYDRITKRLGGKTTKGNTQDTHFIPVNKGKK